MQSIGKADTTREGALAAMEMTKEMKEARAEAARRSLAGNLGDAEPEAVLGAALGGWQRGILRAVLDDGSCPHPLGRALTGRAREYKGHYEDSLLALNERLRDLGYSVEVSRYGMHGGIWSAEVALVDASAYEAAIREIEEAEATAEEAEATAEPVEA